MPFAQIFHDAKSFHGACILLVSQTGTFSLLNVEPLGLGMG